MLITLSLSSSCSALHFRLEPGLSGRCCMPDVILCILPACTEDAKMRASTSYFALDNSGCAADHPKYSKFIHSNELERWRTSTSR